MKKSRFVSILLVNAGPTQWDLQHRFGGTTDLPLSQDGIDRIAALGQAFLGKVASVSCGPEEACKQAAAIFSPQRPKPRVVEAFRDPAIGRWQGMLESELERRYPSCFESWRADPATVSIPSGEEWNDASPRLIGAVLKEGDRLGEGEARHMAVVVRPLAWAELVRLATKRATSDISTILAAPDDVGPYLIDVDRLRESIEEGGFSPASLVPRPLQRPLKRLLGT